MDQLTLSVLTFFGVTALGVMTWTSNRRSADRIAVVQLRADVAALEKKQKTKDDYINDLRDALHTAGMEVPPWPENTLD